jgi:hypothetical protein
VSLTVAGAECWHQETATAQDVAYHHSNLLPATSDRTAKTVNVKFQQAYLQSGTFYQHLKHCWAFFFDSVR